MPAPNDKVLVNPDAWGPEEKVRNALIEWGEQRNLTITHSHDMPSGKSGSRVAVAGVKEGSYRSRDVILKVIPPELAQREQAAIDQARRKTPPEFFRKHLVEVTGNTASPEAGQWWVQEQQIAGVDLREIRTLGDYAGESTFAEMCREIVRAAATEWRGVESDESEETPEGFLRDFLTSPASPRGMAGLRDFARHAGLSVDDPAGQVQIPGRPDLLPNPFQLLAGRSTAEACPRKIKFYRANGHGDFHGGNILIPVVDGVARPAEFRIIDYGRFSWRTPVARDPAKLILDIAGTWLADLKPGTPLWARLAELVAWPERHPEAPRIAGELTVARAVHEAGATWYEEGSLQSWRPQHLVVHLGSALRFVADPALSMDVRWWYFAVAALATRGLIEPATLTSAAAVTPLGESAGGGAAAHHSTAHHSTAHHSTAGRNGNHPEVTGVLAEVAHRIKEDWTRLANHVNAPEDVRRAFRPQQEPFDLMAWLNGTGKVVHLRNSLIDLGGHDDLVALLDADF